MNDNDSETGPLSRALLKGFFKNNAIPTVKNFAALIDGMLIQEDDGIFKSKEGTLSIKAVGDAKQTQTLVNFCEGGQVHPAWKLQLIPVADQQHGFSISDGKDNPRLFIDQAGNIGIGTTTPKGKLDIAGVLWIGEDKIKPGNQSISFYPAAGDEIDAGKITYIEGNPGSLDIIGAGKTTNDRTINLFDHVNVQGNLAVTKEATLAGGLQVIGNTTIEGRIGRVNLTGKLDIAGVLCIGLNGQKSICFARKDGSYSETVGTISYKGEGADKALSFYGAELVGSTTKVIKLYDDVEVSGRFKVNGNLIRKLTKKIGENNTDVWIKDLNNKPIQKVEHRFIEFYKHYDDTAIRIVYYDNLMYQGDKNYPFLKVQVCIKIDDIEKMDIYANIGTFLYYDKGYISKSVTIFGYAIGLTGGKNHKIEVWIRIPSSEKPPSSVHFGDPNGSWVIEVEELLIESPKSDTGA